MLKTFQMIGVILWLIIGIAIALIGSWLAEGFAPMLGRWLMDATKCPFLKLMGLAVAMVLMAFGHLLAITPLYLLFVWINGAPLPEYEEDDEF